jgi:hypothetical protein
MSNDQFARLQAQMSDLQAQIENKLDASLLKMFKYMTGRFDAIEKKLDDKADKSTIDLLYTQLDGFLKRTDTDETERAALGWQVERHEGWIKQIAKTTGNQLEY